MSKCRITVLKRTVNEDLASEYLKSEGPLVVCDAFKDGQQFIAEGWDPPPGFCAWAWADLRGEIQALIAGANYPHIKKPGVSICGCTDWFRPVIFKLERVD